MFTIQYVKDLQWDNEEHTSFSCIVKYEEFNEEHPTGVNAIDQYSHIQELWAKGNAGEYGVIAEYVPPPPPEIIAAPKKEQPTTEGLQTLSEETSEINSQETSEVNEPNNNPTVN